MTSTDGKGKRMDRRSLLASAVVGAAAVIGDQPRRFVAGAQLAVAATPARVHQDLPVRPVAHASDGRVRPGRRTAPDRRLRGLDLPSAPVRRRRHSGSPADTPARGSRSRSRPTGANRRRYMRIASTGSTRAWPTTRATTCRCPRGLERQLPARPVRRWSGSRTTGENHSTSAQGYRVPWNLKEKKRRTRAALRALKPFVASSESTSAKRQS